eukprot:TRINITY_DN3014_c0_g1_i1.p2 TRINITY_DN3014_c0_g1~~TRINITY_DN3014_c0_g1_i1.p2  ORF type:complete len:222 (-),score=-28.44 TRINITY_DN3014_c0_g1_i1:560-1225(-)
MRIASWPLRRSLWRLQRLPRLRCGLPALRRRVRRRRHAWPSPLRHAPPAARQRQAGRRIWLWVLAALVRAALGRCRLRPRRAVGAVAAGRRRADARPLCLLLAEPPPRRPARCRQLRGDGRRGRAARAEPKLYAAARVAVLAGVLLRRSSRSVRRRRTRTGAGTPPPARPPRERRGHRGLRDNLQSARAGGVPARRARDGGADPAAAGACGGERDGAGALL